MFRIARQYGKWPHEVAALPFHLYLALREDWVKTNTTATEGDGLPTADDVIDYNAETLTGESV